MKKIVLLVSLCFALCHARHAAARVTSGEVMVLVKENTDSERKAKHGAAQTVTLDITLNGKPRDPETRMVKWTAYGKDQKGGAVVELKSGEVKVNLSAGSTQKFTTEKITTTYSEKYTQTSSSGGGRSRNRRVTYKEIPGEGVKYLGYGVQVLDGGKVVGEKFDPKSLDKAE